MKMTMRQARLFYGLSMTRIAKEMGVHPKTYSKMEDRADIITVAQFRQFCKIVGVKQGDILLP